MHIRIIDCVIALVHFFVVGDVAFSFDDHYQTCCLVKGRQVLILHYAVMLLITK